MSQITVVRGAGDVAGDPIVDELLANDAAKLERGRVELDLATPANQVSLDVRLADDYAPGALCEVQVSNLGPPVQGIITRVEYTANNSPDMFVKLGIRCPNG